MTYIFILDSTLRFRVKSIANNESFHLNSFGIIWFQTETP